VRIAPASTGLQAQADRRVPPEPDRLRHAKARAPHFAANRPVAAIVLSVLVAMEIVPGQVEIVLSVPAQAMTGRAQAIARIRPGHSHRAKIHRVLHSAGSRRVGVIVPSAPVPTAIGPVQAVTAPSVPVLAAGLVPRDPAVKAVPLRHAPLPREEVRRDHPFVASLLQQGTVPSVRVRLAIAHSVRVPMVTDHVPTAVNDQQEAVHLTRAGKAQAAPVLEDPVQADPVQAGPTPEDRVQAWADRLVRRAASPAEMDRHLQFVRRQADHLRLDARHSGDAVLLKAAARAVHPHPALRQVVRPRVARSAGAQVALQDVLRRALAVVRERRAAILEGPVVPAAHVLAAAAHAQEARGLPGAVPVHRVPAVCDRQRGSRRGMTHERGDCDLTLSFGHCD
jgi:hypothetical protein